MGAEPQAAHVERRRQRNDVGIVRLHQVGQAFLCRQEGAATIDLMHQVIALHRHFEGRSGKDRRRIVDDRIDAAEPVDGSGDGRFHLALVADVALDGKRLAAGRLDPFGRRVDRAFQARIRRVGLGRDDDIGAVARAPFADGQADAAAGAGDEDRLALEAHGCSPRLIAGGG